MHVPASCHASRAGTASYPGVARGHGHVTNWQIAGKTTTWPVPAQIVAVVAAYVTRELNALSRKGHFIP